MEQGPVDAGPYADSEYDGPRRDYSPEQDRADSRTRSAFRSDSMRRQQTTTTTATTSRDVDTDHELRSVKSGTESAQSVGDPPLYPRVGATAEEMAGEVNMEDDDHMKDDATASHQVKDDDSRPHRMHKFTLYETNSRYWITGVDITERYFRLLRIDRNSPPGQIALFEDETVYDRRQMNDVVNAINEGNKSTGGLRMKCSFWGLLGFIRFTEAYYMLIITKRKQVAMIGGHYVFQVEGTDMVALSTGSSTSFLRDRNPEEARFLGILDHLDLSKSFYFSYSYDITHSLQRNITRQREAMNEGLPVAAHEYNGMFVWNSHLLKPAVLALTHPYDWCQPIIHGFLAQSKFDIFGRTVYLTVIGRRSRFFAGARFLKRGVNDLGYVANDVETEQIVAEKLTTSFHAPGPRLFCSPTYTSYVHHRGSIPLYWVQDNSGVTPKPPIKINIPDPFYQAAALHFDNLFERYACPIYVLNLVKSREKTPREQLLLHEYARCVEYLNQSLPADKQILYKAYDMSRMSKIRNGDVIGGLQVIAKEILEKTGFFHNGDDDFEPAQVQTGIARTNCIDCLDRTNAAQFVTGKHAFALQLKALGIIGVEDLDYDTDAINLFTQMFHDHGDNIAMQYGGSHLVNTMATYRKLGHWQNSSQNMVESFKRYYHNSFLDTQRQEAYNLFLGNYIWAQGQPMLWDLATDYYLHHSDPKAWVERERRDYIDWYTPEFLEPKKMPPRIRNTQLENELKDNGIGTFDDYWRECYQPNKLSSFPKVYTHRMTADWQRFLGERLYTDEIHDLSPFVRRLDPHKHHTADTPGKKPQRKGVKILDPMETGQEPSPPVSDIMPRPATAHDDIQSILREPTIYREDPEPLKPLAPTAVTTDEFRPASKAQMHLWTLNRFHQQSLNPHVDDKEEAEYARYISHPTNIPLVTSTDVPSDANIDYVEYVRRSGSSAFDDLDEEDEAETFTQGVNEEDLQSYYDYMAEREEPLTVTEEDLPKKRYKAYQQWLRGKSLFKQSKVDPEYTTA